MPLPPPTGRTKIHTREIRCEGFRRDDGLWDIDGWITDVKHVPYGNFDRGEVPIGEPLHGMGLRLTLDDDLVIKDIVAVTDFSPYRICPEVTPSFKKLMGLKLGKGFKRTVQELVGGALGCVHLVDLLGPIATTAYQTCLLERNNALRAAGKKGATVKPPFFDTCYTWSSDSAIVKHEFPALYTGK